MNIYILLSLACVFVSIKAADICGIPKIKPVFHPTLNNDELGNIVGGYEAVPHSFPWMVSIHFNRKFVCGGSIIGKKWILTAAHCIGKLDTVYKDRFTITIGSNNWSLPQNKTMIYKVFRYYEPGFYRPTLHKDIALLELVREITFSDHVQPICLPEQEEAAQPHLIATGWGVTQGTGSEEILRQVRLSLISNKECNTTKNKEIGFLNDNMICARRSVDGFGVCYGDSGGPLMSNDSEFTKKNKDDTKPWVLYGITSWGAECATVETPGVFTKVSHYVNWVHAIIRN